MCRRFNNVAGKPSFSTLYTAINVMAGHYASYGPKVRHARASAFRGVHLLLKHFVSALVGLKYTGRGGCGHVCVRLTRHRPDSERSRRHSRFCDHWCDADSVTACVCDTVTHQFPIPEKRRKRLQQEFSEIERNIKRSR